MKISKEARNQARLLAQACTVDGIVQHDRARKVVARLKEAKPRGYLAILSQFVELIRLKLAENEAKVQTAAPLDEAAKAELEAKIRADYGAHLDISYSQNPELIGGMKLQIGSRVFDSSMKARLERLQNSFS